MRRDTRQSENELEIHRAARPLGVRIPRPPPLLKHLGEPTYGARIDMDDHRKVRPDSLSGTALKLWGATRFPVRGSRSRFSFESCVVVYLDSPCLVFPHAPT